MDLDNATVGTVPAEVTKEHAIKAMAGVEKSVEETDAGNKGNTAGFPEGSTSRKKRATQKSADNCRQSALKKHRTILRAVDKFRLGCVLGMERCIGCASS